MGENGLSKMISSFRDGLALGGTKGDEGETRKQLKPDSTEAKMEAEMLKLKEKAEQHVNATKPTGHHGKTAGEENGLSKMLSSFRDGLALEGTKGDEGETRKKLKPDSTEAKMEAEMLKLKEKAEQHMNATKPTGHH